MSHVRARLGLPGFDDALYWRRVHDRARELRSDGCSGPAIPVHVDACYEHDCHYREHLTVLGVPITRADADAVLRERIQERSPFGILSPMSWWRWAAVRLGGYWAYHDLDRGTSLVSALIVVAVLFTACAPTPLPTAVPAQFCRFNVVDLNTRLCDRESERDRARGGAGFRYVQPHPSDPCGACVRVTP